MVYYAQTIQVPGLAVKTTKSISREWPDCAGGQIGLMVKTSCTSVVTREPATMWPSSKIIPFRLSTGLSAQKDFSLKEGKRLFGKDCFRWFENTEEGLLYTGSKEDIQAKARELVAEMASRHHHRCGLHHSKWYWQPPYCWVREALAE